MAGGSLIARDSLPPRDLYLAPCPVAGPLSRGEGSLRLSGLLRIWFAEGATIRGLHCLPIRVPRIV